MTALDDRRQRALEAAYDNPHISDKARTSTSVRMMLRDGIETATRVQITPEFVTAMLHEVDRIGVQNGGIEAGLKAAFEAAGFEVIE